MLSINNCKYELIINKSRFIGLGFKVDSIDEVKNILKDMKNAYKGATHYCYAYIIDNNQKCVDDGEPSGTAGLPIYNVLNNNHLNHILVIIIRYFGGIKLGSGGLIRAYSNTTSNLINFNIIDIKEQYKYIIEFEYPNESKILNILKDSKIISKNYEKNIIYEIIISDETLDIIKNLLLNYEKKGKLFI